ncbi:MAG: anhydro-N-acetylmuramic acid kinase [Bacteroidales bacterium]|nr:anhydro-N-acetylmuramic acid kinase [Bacteroidales bacterium]
MKKEISVIGVMSGTSLDGLDLCHCTFSFTDNKWCFKIDAAQTIKYQYNDQIKLQNANNLTAENFLLFHNSFGEYISLKLNEFISMYNLNPDFIASHGHTIFHQPEKKFTFQIGSGAVIAANTGVDTISDFRSLDVALAGQGAPLVPIGDQLLFPEYDFCLNLGGFANISTLENGKRVAWDICPVNIAINHYMKFLNQDFDNFGLTAQTGNLNISLLEKLNNIPFFKKDKPKSLGKEWLMKEFIPIIEGYNISIHDKLNTIYHCAAQQIAKNINKKDVKILTTGGGAYNKYLISLIEKQSRNSLIIPTTELVDFKEAVIFAFLGVLFSIKETNTLHSVTGAKRNSIGGCLYYGSK